MAEHDQLKTRLDQAVQERQNAAARLAELEGTLRDLRVKVALARAEADSASATVDSLRSAMAELAHDAEPTGSLGSDLRHLNRTDAIIAVLAAAGNDLGLEEILDRLHQAGRDDSYNVVVSTLNYLTKEKRVARPRRGRYQGL